MTDKPYEIRQAARLSGVDAHRIRAWERRYAAVKPGRTDGNIRIYSDSDIRRLTLLGRAVGSGHRISRLADMDDETLQGLVGPVGGDGERAVAGDKNLDKFLCDAGYAAVCRLDAPALYGALSQAAVSQTRRRLLSGFVQPLLARVGAAWAGGELKIANEHMATAAVAALLGELLRDAMPATDAAPILVVATPSGQRHALGALALALTAAEAGWQPLCLGADLPAADMAAAAVQTAAGGVAVSISHALDPPRTVRELRRLRQFLPVGTDVFAGGAAAARIQAADPSMGIRWCESLSVFHDCLASAAGARKGPSR